MLWKIVSTAARTSAQGLEPASLCYSAFVHTFWALEVSFSQYTSTVSHAADGPSKQSSAAPNVKIFWQLRR